MIKRTTHFILAQALTGYFTLIALIVLCGCNPQETGRRSLLEIASGSESIKGTEDYKNSPFVAAGNRVYVVGHQDGTFPDLGWHVDGEMGGIWNHPIKLMDGFEALLVMGNDSICLSEAEEFINFPFGNQHTYKVGDLNIERFQFVPDNTEGVVVEYSIKNLGSTATIGFVFTGLIDLMPVWLSERQEIVEARDQARYNDENEAFIAKDLQNDWYVTLGADRRPDFHGTGNVPCGHDNKGKGTSASMRFDLDMENGKSEIIRFFIAGSYQSLENTWLNHDALKKDPVDLLKKKIERYDRIDKVSRIEVGDDGFDRMYRWIKYNTDWLMRKVPEHGTGLSAGIPDYPWWFGTDNTYSIQGMLAAGMHEEALATIDLIIDISRKENVDSGKIMHETSTNGEVFNPGNLNTTPYFIYALWKAYMWTGDQRILDEYYDDVGRGITWIESQDKDGNGYPDGAGMMEIHGLHSEMIDVVAYQAAAYYAAANFAGVMGDDNLAAAYSAKAAELKEKINSVWWVDDFNSFADFRASREETIKLIEDAIIRADTIDKPAAKIELNQTLNKLRSEGDDGATKSYVVHHNWVVNTPMELKLAEPGKALRALETARQFRNRFGMYVTGMDRDENREKAEKWKAFSYVGAVMTLPTGVQAIAESNYGNSDEALNYLKMLENSFSYALPGSMYEVSPDYGMIAQAWNIYAVAIPVVEHFFGIRPKAYKQEVDVTPAMPSSWNDVAVTSVKVGDNELSISRTITGTKEVYTIEQLKTDWTINFSTQNERKINLNGTALEASEKDGKTISFTGTRNEIEIQ